MRGARSCRAPYEVFAGIIPADAGSTVLGRNRARRVPDHPRGCGEHGVGVQLVTPERGSSPRMRGAQRHEPFHLQRGGIIPADAGSTVRARPNLGRPRGSSPRMRGARCGGRDRVAVCRIIPADAGSTRVRLSCPGGCRDHPRGCGEHMAWMSISRMILGSSPRMRGAPVQPASGVGAGGIIPADAGSTSPSTSGPFRKWDHPRGCGEHDVWNRF